MSELEFGRYEPLFRIAAGGMAEVHAARIRGEAGFEKLVAVKRMLPHLTDDPEFVAMFLDEGRLAANIHSPHVVSTLDLGRAEDGSLYIVMDLVVGTALSTLLRAAARAGRFLPVPIACEILAQAATGLDDAHEARTPTGVHLGIVHRDVSPQNVLVGADGRTRVVDFGVARAVLRQSHTSTGTLKGKFGYFSPEQAAARELDPRSDVFALGIVSWETLIGRRLFESDNPLETITRVRSMPIPRPTALRPEIPEAVSSVVMRALERDRERRWESAGAFAAALREAVGANVSTRDVAALVADIGGPAVREMQARIEAAMAGEHLVTKARPVPRISEEPGQATPSGVPGHVADLPTLVRPSEDVLTPTRAPVPVVSAAPPRAPTSRWWIAGLAVSAVLALIVGVALASQGSSEPIATPLSLATSVHVDTVPPPTSVGVPSVEIPPSTTTLDAVDPMVRPPPHLAGRDPIEPTHRPPDSIGPIAPEPPRPTTTRTTPHDTIADEGAAHATTPHDTTPHETAAHDTTAHDTTGHETATSHDTTPRDTSRHTAGLAGDDAFDQGL